MDYSRIEHNVDTQAVAGKTVAVIGLGGFAQPTKQLAQSGVEDFRLEDPDTVGIENLCRQGFVEGQVGQSKVDAVYDDILAINPRANVIPLKHDFCAYSDEELRGCYGDVDLFIAATDNHLAQARVNQAALLLDKPAVFIGVYRSGSAAEVEWWVPWIENLSCYRCLVPSRYAHHEITLLHTQLLHGTVFDTAVADAVGCMIALAILTRGANNRYGKLLDQLGRRNFLQIKLDPAWTLGGTDPVRQYLQIPEGNDAYFSFCTVAREDPEPGGQCPDCLRYRRKEAS